MSTRSDRQRSVNDRIRVVAAGRSVDANRLRRSLVFQRILVRLAPHGFILKGGFCLEVRMPDVARTTKDLDLVSGLALVSDPEVLLDELDPLLAAPADDGFTFQASLPVRLRDEGSPNAWRVGIAARLDGTEFERVKLDLVAQTVEAMGATEMLAIPPPVPIAGFSEVQVRAVDVYQHAAEKFHAYSRLYAHERPSSRVKDLIDLVLLIEADLVRDYQRLRHRLGVVYEQRDRDSPPRHLPRPPEAWAGPFAALAIDLGLSAHDVQSGYHLADKTYSTALQERNDE